MSKAQTGEKHSMFSRKHRMESKEKISNSIKGENHPLYGKGHSEETKMKMKDKFKKVYKITYKDGTYEIIKGMEEWIENNKISRYFLKKLKNGEINEYNDIISIGRIVDFHSL